MCGNCGNCGNCRNPLFSLNGQEILVLMAILWLYYGNNNGSSCPCNRCGGCCCQ